MRSQFQLGVIAGMLALGVAACGSSDSSTATSPEPVVISGTELAEFDGLALVAGGTSNVPAAELPDELTPAVEEFLLSGGEPVVISPSAEPQIVDADLLPIPENGTASGNANRAKKNIGRIEVALQRPATAGGLSAFNAILMAVDAMSDAKQPLVVVITSGLDTAGSMDATGGLFQLTPDEIANHVSEQNPGRDLSSLQVVLVGIGYTADPQVALTPAQRQLVTEAWRRSLEALGATVYVSESPSTAEAAASDWAVPVTDFSDPCVAGVESLTYSFDSSSMSFAPASATLPDNAATALVGVVAAAADAVEAAIEVVGHTDAQGTDEENLALGQARAEAVAAYLRTQLPSAAITATSEGEHAPRVSEAGLSGQLLDNARTVNRRVELHVSGVELTCK